VAVKKAGSVLRYSEHLSAEYGETMFRHACAMGPEGIVFEEAHEPLQVGLVQEVAEGQDPAYERRTGA
jgi:hypothetical protein